MSHVAYIENVPEGADSEQVFRSLSRKGFNLIFGTSFGFGDPMEAVAGEFPDVDVHPSDRYQIQLHELWQPDGRHGKHEVSGWYAGWCARQAGWQSQTWLYGHLPDPRRNSPWQCHCFGHEEDLP